MRISIVLGLLLSLNSHATGGGGVGPAAFTQARFQVVSYIVVSASDPDANGIYTVEVLDSDGHKLVLKVTQDQIVRLPDGRWGITNEVRVWGI